MRDEDLARAIRALPGTGGPSFEALVYRMSHRQARPLPHRQLGLGIAAVAAAAALAVLTPAVTRDRGFAAGDVHLEAAAEGPSGLRPLGPNAEVRPGETVLFRVTSTGGRLVIREGNRTILDERVEPGVHVPGGARPETWRADAVGTHRYEAVLCPLDTDTGCVRDAVTLTWR